jgi:quercetin dioxygenase-like cupin family protein
MNTKSNAVVPAVVSLVAAWMLATPLAAVAQSTVAPLPPAGFKVIHNDDRVRVFESTFAPGIVVPMTNYPRRTVYVLKGPSQFSYSHADGRTETLTQQAGDVSSRERERMSITNVGANEAVILVVIDKRDVPAQ